MSGSSVCTPVIPPHAAQISPLPRAFSSGGQGEWSEAMQSIVPAAGPFEARAQADRDIVALRVDAEDRIPTGDTRHPVPQHAVVRAGELGSRIDHEGLVADDPRLAQSFEGIHVIGDEAAPQG